MRADGSPTVSVVIPFLDPPIEFLSEAVESVKAQTFTDWELLLVDDGSVGEATPVARQYAAGEPERIVYLDFEGHVNRGLAAARNLGLRHARGDYVAMLDSDDIWVPEKLERQVRILHEWPEAAMVYGTTRYWSGWTGRDRDVRRDFVQRHELFLRHRGRGIGDRLIRPPALLTMYLRDEAAVPSASNIMVRRSTLLQVGGFDTRFQLYEDQTLYAKVCLSAPVFVAEECWDSYRQHPDSMCARARGTDRVMVARRDYLEWLADYLERSGVRDAALWRELERNRLMARHGQVGRVVGAVSQHFRRLVGTPYQLD